MTPPVPPPPLPRGIRFAAALSLVFSLLTGYFTLAELGQMQQLEEGKASRQAPRKLLAENPELGERVAEAQVSALRSMEDSRGVLLGSLLVAYTLVFVSSARVLRPEGLRLESLRRLLVGALLSAALLRTVEGAQSAVIAQRMLPTLLEVMRARPDFKPEELEAIQHAMPSVVTGAAVLLTAFVAGTFSLLAQYFRSERVRQALGARDPHPARED